MLENTENVLYVTRMSSVINQFRKKLQNRETAWACAVKFSVWTVSVPESETSLPIKPATQLNTVFVYRVTSLSNKSS